MRQVMRLLFFRTMVKMEMNVLCRVYKLNLICNLEEPIQTMLEVCDSRSACNFTLGPKVTAKLPINFSETETL